MNNNFVKKSMIFGIIILFVGASGVSSITDYDKDVENTDYKDETLNMKNNDYNNLIKQVIESGVISTYDWWERDKLLASDGAYWDLFGFSVSIYGEYAIVGAYWDDDNGDDSGSAYIFKRDGTIWNEQVKLLASDGAIDDSFGYSVSISGDYSIIGAFGDDDNGASSGSAYIFKRDGTTWNEQAKLLASDGADYNFFGISVSIDGEYAIVGTPFDGDNGYFSGSAYIFKRDGTIWNEQAKLIDSDGAEGDFFGCSVSIDGDYTIVGAYGDGDNGNYSGSAYIFIRSGTAWLQHAKLLASDGAEDDFFGYSVSIDGEYAIVGACCDDDNGDYSGSAYIFKRDGATWNEHAKLLASDGAYWDLFGCSVSIDGDYTIVGAYGDDDNGNYSGSAYIFKRDGTIWNEQAKLLASDGAEYDSFGYSVSIDGEYTIVGAYGDGDNGNYSGSAYVFTNALPEPDLECDGSLTWTDVKPGSTVTGSFTVKNIGDPGSELDWEIQSFPGWGDWTFDPESGTGLLPGTQVTVDVEIVAPDEQEETFTGEIVLVNIEDPTDTCIIDVSLATPVGQVQSNRQIYLERYLILEISPFFNIFIFADKPSKSISAYAERIEKAQNTVSENKGAYEVYEHCSIVIK